MKPQVNKKAKYFRSIFRRVFARYDELKSVEGTNSCAPFYHHLAHSDEAPGSGNPMSIKILTSDFIADIELTAKKTLNTPEYKFFRDVYLNKTVDPEQLAADCLSNPSVLAMKCLVQEQLGKAFKAKHIYPVTKYFNGKELR